MSIQREAVNVDVSDAVKESGSTAENGEAELTNLLQVFASSQTVAWGFEYVSGNVPETIQLSAALLLPAAFELLLKMVSVLAKTF